MSILLILFVIWFIGWVVSIYPIYNALITNQMKQANKEANRGYNKPDAELDNGDVVNSAVGATFFGMFWYVVLPFYISFAIRNHGKPKIETEIIKAKEVHAHKKLLEQARKELEAGSIVDVKESKPPSLNELRRKEVQESIRKLQGYGRSL